MEGRRIITCPWLINSREVSMKVRYCPTCGKDTGHQRRLGFGTFFAVVLTGGLWLLALPFYPKRCIVCGSED